MKTINSTKIIFKAINDKDNKITIKVNNISLFIFIDSFTISIPISFICNEDIWNILFNNDFDSIINMLSNTYNNINNDNTYINDNISELISSYMYSINEIKEMIKILFI